MTIQPIPGKNTQPDPVIRELIAAAAEYNDKYGPTETKVDRIKLPNYSADPLKFYDYIAELTPEQLTRTWAPISEKKYYYYLEVLPPIRLKGSAFMVGECITHTQDGAIYDALIKYNGGYWKRPAYLHTFNPEAWRREIQALNNK